MSHVKGMVQGLDVVGAWHLSPAEQVGPMGVDERVEPEPRPPRVREVVDMDPVVTIGLPLTPQ